METAANDYPQKCVVCGRILDPELELAKCRSCEHLWPETVEERDGR